MKNLEQTENQQAMIMIHDNIHFKT